MVDFRMFMLADRYAKSHGQWEGQTIPEIAKAAYIAGYKAAKEEQGAQPEDVRAEPQK